MRRTILVVVSALLILAMLCLTGSAEKKVSRDPATHNYILVIDNSKSTTGPHSLGSATDPKDLRFDAAKLVYENVLSAAATGAKGQIGVIVFCGPQNCVSYGPMDIQSDVELLDLVIGNKLNEQANEAYRDAYTDIKTALEQAGRMMQGFAKGSETSVILLTDGVNDLTNSGNPFTQSENILLNEQTVQQAQALHARGAELSVVALATQDSVRDINDCMGFMRRVAIAGGA